MIKIAKEHANNLRGLGEHHECPVRIRDTHRSLIKTCLPHDRTDG